MMKTNPDASTLCLACGLCCNGVLHPYAHVAAAERDFVQSLGLTVAPFGSELGFTLPCSLFQGGRCSTYAQARPRTCIGYRCKLLKQYLAGPVSLDQAGLIIRRTRELLAEVITHMPAGYSFEQVWRELGQDWDGGEGMFQSPLIRQMNGQWLLSVVKLLRYSQKHFDNKGSTGRGNAPGHIPASADPAGSD